MKRIEEENGAKKSKIAEEVWLLFINIDVMMTLALAEEETGSLKQLHICWKCREYKCFNPDHEKMSIRA